MRQESGISMVMMVITIMVLLIIATTTIVLGNKAVLESREYKEMANTENVKNAIERLSVQHENNPLLYPLIGSQNPYLSFEPEVRAGEDWYFINADGLRELGISKDKETYFVNYKTHEVIPSSNKEKMKELIINSGGTVD